ncbi:PREDICTED: gelsolin, cytoplasmic-like [Priapulus caudatus]|uniref:Gelsolin, cytoplasmic-like n=1 Tax=Priapulus caudatus TaxID=37621 RepID=A0ABM1EHL8_PRICU|nr:PREDICTED: gelsolin, cytoplasmic-like [Priapulus caudatus]
MVAADDKPFDEAFQGVGQKLGLEIWRIESMKVVPVPKQYYGQFYSGDSYIVMKTRQVENRLEWDIHFWLGKETSQDEQGVAAYKTVELDDSLGGAPVQYRETQGHESKKFLSFFKKGIKYLQGGVASGFNHVAPDSHQPRLLHVKGKRNVRATQVECNVGSLNAGDVFVLDCGMDVYVWCGPDSGRMERHRGIRLANDVRDNERAGRADIHILDGTTSDDDFFAALGGRGEIKSAEEGGLDDEVILTRRQVALYRVSDEKMDETNKAIKAVRVGVAPLEQSALDAQDCFILDSGKSGIFVWIGKQSSNQERAAAMKHASNYVTARDYPGWTPVTRVIDGAEPAMFRQYFNSWTRQEHHSAVLGANVSVGEVLEDTAPESVKELPTISKRRKRIFNWGPLAKHGGRACGFMPDDGTGNVEIWRIHKFKMVPLEPDQYGFFCGGDSYVIKYSYRKKLKEGKKSKKENYIIYFWQGKESSQDEKAVSAFSAVKLDDELGGAAVQIRVVQGREPEHFLTIFKGRMVVLMGGKASGFKNIHDHDTFDVDGTRLFHVRGSTETNTRALQVAEVPDSLNSEDVFVLETPSNTFVWQGKGCIDVERQMGFNLAGIVSPGGEAVSLEEGEEPEEFWICLGGYGEYPSKHDWENPRAAATRDLPGRTFASTRGLQRASEIESWQARRPSMGKNRARTPMMDLPSTVDAPRPTQDADSPTPVVTAKPSSYTRPALDTPVCCPQHASSSEGREPFHTGVYTVIGSAKFLAVGPPDCLPYH